ncbi:uncharacterized protein LOC112200403 [Rosa chinensis]|uniref:uncharacterized protein LOC112200403 n=1 Tax=Rosa chinensis TaxID=74649 RepID=UPI000D08767D|nr:uncharacterized protein LOC112200403 [Rosa chinensis]
MDRAEVDNFLEAMYASGLAAQKIAVDPDTLALRPSEAPVVLPMPHHSHLGGDGLPAVQGETGAASEAAPRKERGPAIRRGVAKKTVRPTEGVTIAGLEPSRGGARAAAAGASMPVVQPSKEASPTTSTAPTAAPTASPGHVGARSGSGESGGFPEGDSQRTPTQSEMSRAGFLAAHTRANGTVETPSPTARGSDQTSRAHPPQAASGDAEGSGADVANPANP